MPMKKLFYFFLQGLLFVVPAAVTIYFVYMAIIWIDNLIPIHVHIPLPGIEDKDIPGLGILVMFLGIAMLGYIGTRFVRNPFFIMFEGLVERTPLLKIIYSSVKDLVEAFVGEKKRFTQPVLVTVNHSPVLQRVGFVTNDDLTDLGLGRDKIAVYLPFSYGFNGQLMIIDAGQIQKIDASGTEMMKFVISGGVTDI